MRIVTVFCILLLAFLLHACSKSKAPETRAESISLTYAVRRTIPHNDKAFTEGLVMQGDKLLESTGQNGESWIAEVDLNTGRHDKKIILDDRYFGEGITVLNNKIFQLTYRAKTGFIYDATTYRKIGEFKFNTVNNEGWGITHNGTNLIMSSGSEKLDFLDTADFHITRTLAVTYPGGTKAKNLNELEYVDGYIFANVFETGMILKIDSNTGKVVGELNLSVLADEIERMHPRAYEMNGIAYDKSSDTFFITGKFWPKSYLIKVQ